MSFYVSAQCFCSETSSEAANGFRSSSSNAFPTGCALLTAAPSGTCLYFQALTGLWTDLFNYSSNNL